MMQYIRERATSKFAKFLFLGIIISFFGFGGSGFFNSMNDSTVAKVNGEKISTSALNNAYTNYLQNNGGVLPEGANAQNIKLQVLNSMIQEMVVAQAAKKMGIVASDEQIRQYIKSLSFLKNAEGEFDPDLYKFYLQQMGLTSVQWEENLRQQLTLQLLMSAIGDSVVVTNSNLEDFAKIDRERRDLSIILLPLQEFMNNSVVTDEQISVYYEQNKDQLLTEPRVKLAYVTLPMLDESVIDITDEAINQRVAELKAKQLDNETRSSDQLIIQFNTQSEKDAAFEILNQLYDALLADEITYDSAKEKITALSDGLFYQTGITKKSANMQDIDNALFAMSKTDVYAKPVASENAVHLIHLLSVNDGSNIADADLIKKAKDALFKEQKESLNAENIQKFQEIAEKNADGLELIAQEFQIEPIETDWLSLTAKNGELADQNTYQVVTQEMVLLGGKNSEAYHTDKQNVQIVRVVAYEDTRNLTQEEAKDDIQLILTQQMAQQKAEGVIAEINESLKLNTQSLEQIAEAKGLDVKKYSDVDIRSIIELAQTQPEYIEALVKGFEVQKNESDALSSFVSGDNLAAVSVTKVVPGDLSLYSSDEKEQLESRLKSEMSQAETILFIQGLYDQGKIETYQVPFLTE